MYPNIICNGIRDGAIGIATRLRDGRSGVPIPMGTEVCLFSKNVHTVSESFSVSYCMGMGTVTPGVKWPEPEGDHSSPYNATIKSDWNCTCNPVLGFTAYVLIIMPLLYEKPIFVSQRNKLLLHY
jgi:hypothetical protein